MDASTLLLAVFALGYLAVVGWAYGRRGRWFGAAGWAVLMAGLLLALGGGGDLFAWAGLLWSMLALFGLLIVAIDIAETRRRPRG